MFGRVCLGMCVAGLGRVASECCKDNRETAARVGDFLLENDLHDCTQLEDAGCPKAWTGIEKMSEDDLALLDKFRHDAK